MKTIWNVAKSGSKNRFIDEKKIDEEMIRFLLLKDLLRKNKHIELATIEMSLMYSKRRVDLMLIEDKEFVAYEIKSCKDNLARLDGQISDYLKIFDKVYVVLDRKFRKSISDIPNQVGIIIFDSEKLQFKLERKPKKNNPKIYYQSLFVDNKKLQSYKVSDAKYTFDVRHSLINRIEKNEKNVFKNFLLECLKQKYFCGFELFRKIEHQKELHLSDMYLLYASSYIGNVN